MYCVLTKQFRRNEWVTQNIIKWQNACTRFMNSLLDTLTINGDSCVESIFLRNFDIKQNHFTSEYFVCVYASIIYICSKIYKSCIRRELGKTDCIFDRAKLPRERFTSLDLPLIQLNQCMVFCTHEYFH